MDFDVMNRGKAVGQCRIEDRGLYWHISCLCPIVTGKLERLYWQEHCLGVLEATSAGLRLERTVSKTSLPWFPADGLPSLEPEELWRGAVLDLELPPCRKEPREGGWLLKFPFDENKPCPCMPFLCFFAIRGGFWQMLLDEQMRPVFPEETGENLD